MSLPLWNKIPEPLRTEVQGVFSNALVVDVLEKKYALHLPLYRQSQQIERDSGYAPSRSTLSDRVLEVGTSLRLVKEAIKAELLAGGYIQADEARVRTNDFLHPEANIATDRNICGSLAAAVRVFWPRRPHGVVPWADLAFASGAPDLISPRPPAF